MGDVELGKTLCEYLDEIKTLHDLKSDNQLALKLGVTRQTVSHYRMGKSAFDTAVAIRAASLLSVHPAQIIASIERERAKRTEEKQVWAQVEKMFAGHVTPVLILALAIVFGYSATELGTMDVANFTASPFIHYTKCLAVILAAWLTLRVRPIP